MPDLQDFRRKFNNHLTHSVKNGDFARVQETLVAVVEESLKDPRTGSLEGLDRTVAILVSDYARETDVTNNLLRIAFKDYSTVVHSIRVMVEAIEYGYYKNLPLDTINSYRLSALLHDVGKMTIPRHIDGAAPTWNITNGLTERDIRMGKTPSHRSENSSASLTAPKPLPVNSALIATHCPPSRHLNF